MRTDYDYAAICRDWLKTIRGRVSQRELSKRLGYDSNVLYRWETGRAHPSARAVLGAMESLGFSVSAALHRFYGGRCPWLHRVDPTSREGVAQLLEDLRKPLTLSKLAEESGFTRYQVTRWLQSTNEPRLHEWLAVLHAASGRLLDFIAAFFGEQTLPSVRKAWQLLVATRAAAYEHPESHIILRALELRQYIQLEQHEPGCLARLVGLSLEAETLSLRLLEAAGQITFQAGKWTLSGTAFVDTRADARRSRELRAYWLRRTADAVEAGHAGTFGYSLFSISRKDYERAQQIHARYYRELSQLIAESEPSERVVLFGAQLYPLDAESRATPPKRG